MLSINPETTMSEVAQKSYTADDIRTKLETDNKWLFRGLLAIYKRQTEDEQRTDQTNHNNNVGFNGTDAAFLSIMARRALEDKPFSEKQIACIRKAMRKYAGQLYKISKGVI
jgi:hypothetical protein